MTRDGDFPEERETAAERILEMIVRQCEPPEIFHAVCLQIGETEEERQVALFTLHADSWKLKASGELTAQSKEVLARLVPEYISGQLLAETDSGSDGAEFEDGWARHLYSGIGEMLGLLVCLDPKPFTPEGRHAARIEALCRLTTLAIEQWNLREELTWKGDHDSVTGLYTQAFFERTLATQMQQNETPLTLLHVNLDRFRLVNDVLGRALGDRILRYVGRRFSSIAKGDDLIARVGGDEFAVLLKPGTFQRAADTAECLLHSLTSCLSIDAHQVFISASIGVASSHAGSTPQTLQREAYVALYHAKKTGKSRALAFDQTMETTPPERLEMEKCLRSAIAGNEMLLYYQPQINLTTGCLAGAEALLRWKPAGVGIISPATIIPILEETGLIVEFGHWALREACAQGRRWMESTGTPVRIGVNISALQLGNPGFVDDVRGVLKDSDFPAEYLELELTESLFIHDYSRARDTLRELRALGIALALDDFGTGQSSLSYLQELPFQRLKIDQSFVRAIHGMDRCPAVVANIVTMAKSLGMTTIAEGIERPDQAEALRAISCDEGQGYLYSEPLPAAEFLLFQTIPENQFSAS